VDYSVFVSSTRKDLIPYRESVSRQLSKAGYEVIGMETMGARDQEPLEACLQDVAEADLFVGIYAWRYGFVPRDSASSITEQELIEAERLRKPIVCFIVDDDYEWPPDQREGGEGARKLAELKSRLREQKVVAPFTTPESLADGAVKDLKREVDRQLSVDLPPDRAILFNVLDKVERFWVQGVLQDAIFGGRRLRIVREERPDVVGRPAPKKGQTAAGEVREPIHDFFLRKGRSLLILGPLGVGKTVALIELARGLGRVARRDPRAAVPVVFNLASWKGHDRSLAAWMVRELARHYKAGRKQAEAWIKSDAILPLLDGLDEMDQSCRPGCVEAINAHLQDHELITGMAVACHTQGYEELPLRLELETAVELRPLTPEQVDEHLAAAGPPLAALRAALAGNAALQELTTSPLMLDLFQRTFWDSAPGDGPAGRIPDRVEEVLEDYVAHVLEPERQLPWAREQAERPRGLRSRLPWNRSRAVQSAAPNSEDLYPPARTRRALAWLAHGMAEHDPALFQVERLQPAWLAARGKAFNLFSLAAYSLLSHTVGGTLLALPLALAFRWQFAGAGLAAGALVGFCEIPRLLRTGPPQGRTASILGRRLARTLYLALLVCLFLVWIGPSWLLLTSDPGRAPDPDDLLQSAVAVGLLFGMVFGSRGAVRTGSRDIRVAEALVWRGWSGRWAAFGFGGLLLACMTFWGFFSLALGSRTSFGADFWVPFSAIVSLLGAGLIGAFGGLGGRALEEKDWPNQGTWLALRNAGFAALAAGLAAILALELSLTSLHIAQAAWGGDSLSPGRNLGNALVLLKTGAGLGFWFGLAYSGLDFVQHFSLRLVLRLWKLVPGRLVGLLDHAVERGLLQRPGGSYKFFHPLLLDHFAKSYGSLTRTPNLTAATGASAPSLTHSAAAPPRHGLSAAP
jgi:hypothetical protein